MNDPPEQREISLAEADNDRLANFAGPMEQNLRHVEERLKESGRWASDSTLGEMDALWNEAKARERAAQEGK